MPITWRNIEAPSLVGVAGMAESARRTFNDAMSSLRSGFDEYGEQIQTQWDQGKEANTQAFLDQLAQYKTPEELAAAQAAGALQNLKAQFGNQIDRNAVRDAEAQQADVLMRRIAAQNQYADDKTNRDARPLVDQFNSLIADNKLDEARKFLQSNVLGTDESAFSNLILDRNDKQFSQSMEKSRLALQQAQERRSQIDWNDKWNEINQSRAAVDLGDQAMANATDFASARTAYLASAKQKGLRDDVVNLGLENLQKTYQARTGLTPEQDAAISSNPEYLKLAKDAELNKELLGRNRYNDVKNFHITPEEAIGKVFKRVPDEEDNTAIKIQDEIKTFLTGHPSAKDINLGPVLEQALASAGINENTVFDDDLNLEGFQDKLAKAYADYNAYDKLKDEAKKSESKATTLRQALTLKQIQDNMLRNR